MGLTFQRPWASMPNTNPNASAPRNLVIRSVGTLKNKALTSRDAQLHNFLEKCLELGSNKIPIAPIRPESQELGFFGNQMLREWVVFQETGNLSVSELNSNELESAFLSVRDHLNRNPFYKNLEYSEKEIREALTRKLKARKFVKFKRESAVAPVTDSEAQKYFNENRGRFGADAQFDNYRESIKSALDRQRIDQRMQDWYGILLRKYEARNHLTDI